MIGVVAQMCDANKDFAEYLLDWEFVEAISCQYAGVIGFPVFAMLVWAAVGGAIYIRTDSFLIPFGLLLFTGGAVISQMASLALLPAVLITLFIPALAITALYVRYNP